MAGRYIIEGPWSPEPVSNDVVVVETATLVDTQGGWIYPQGAYRVRLLVPVEGKRTKTFKGESAWSQAESFARDVTWAARRAS